MEIDANMNLGPVSSPLPATTRSATGATPAADTDTLSGTNPLMSALQTAPDIRPDVVAKGRAAVSTDGYPPSDVLKKLSSFLAGKLQTGNDSDAD